MRLARTSLLALSLALGPLLVTPPAHAFGDEFVVNGGFEANDTWTYTDTIFPSPYCDVTCGTGNGTTGPASGSAWLWFGGAAGGPHHQSARQVVTLPGETPGLTLTYKVRVGAYDEGTDARLVVTWDGDEVDRIEPGRGDEVTPGYRTLQVALPNDQAAGAHTLRFDYFKPARTPSNSNINIDDVSVVDAPPVPAITGADPANGTSGAPRLTGTAGTGLETVSVFANGTCTGTPVATGPAGTFTTTGLQVPARAGANTYSVIGTATGVDSQCSKPFTYTAVPPQTTITKKPGQKITKTTAKLTFTSNVPGSTFQCKVDSKPFKSCASPFTVKNLKLGKHTVQIRAVASGGLADPTPAKATFKVVRR